VLKVAYRNASDGGSRSRFPSGHYVEAPAAALFPPSRNANSRFPARTRRYAESSDTLLCEMTEPIGSVEGGRGTLPLLSPKQSSAHLPSLRFRAGGSPRRLLSPSVPTARAAPGSRTRPCFAVQGKRRS